MQIELFEGENNLNVTMTLIESNLTGAVTDAVSGSPIAGVAVSIDGRNTSTSSSGAFSFTGLVPGDYNITFSKNGYYPIS
jgi:hypothetical protein